MRCLGCMKEYDSGSECPFCGYSADSPAEKSNHLAPGTMISGSYLIGKALGSGGFGITYIGWDSRSGRPVAIKEYLPGVFAYRTPGMNTVSCYDKDSERKFRAGIVKTIEESNCLARLNSLEGVVSVYNCVEANGTVYIIMEYLEGKTLKEILETKGKFTFEESVSIMAPILRALSEVHEENIIHRDVSPDNIFICDDSTVKLIDFGAARDSFSDEKSLSVVLKRGYAPKEQYSGGAMQGPWTDIYACAATLYRMLTGIVPQESLGRDISDNLVSLHDMGVDIPEYAEKAIMHSLAVDYRDRTFSASEFLRQLVDPRFPVTETAPTIDRGAEHMTVEEPDEPEAVSNGEEGGQKKKLPILLIIAAVLVIGAGIAAAVFLKGKEPEKVIVDSGTCGSGVTWSLDDSGSFEIGGSGRMSGYNGRGSLPWAASAGKIKSVTVNGSVQNIGKNAFSGCSALTDLVIYNGIQSIDESAFSDCTALKEVILPDTVTVINSNAFFGCTALEKIHIPASVVSFGEGFMDETTAFICSSDPESDVKSYAASQGIKFVQCEGHVIRTAAEADDPLSTTAETESTTSVIMSGMCGAEVKWELRNDGILHISGKGEMDKSWRSNDPAGAGSSVPGWKTYSDKITSVVIDEGVASVGPAAFAGCTLIKTVSLPGSVTGIGAGAFSGCTALESVSIPAGLSDIGEQAFKGCTSLASIELNCRASAISDECFAGCSALSSVVLPAGTARIGGSAFSGCSALAQITLPANVKKIGSSAFSDCTSLSEVVLPYGLRDIPTSCFKNSGLTEFDIPSGVETVGDYAFSSCTKLKEIKIENGVAAIGKGSFSCCVSLEKAVLPDSVTLVGQYAFSDCSSLSFVHVSSNLKNIGDSAFANTKTVICCDSLLSTATSYCIKNSIGYEHCNGRH